MQCSSTHVHIDHGGYLLSAVPAADYVVTASMHGDRLRPDADAERIEHELGWSTVVPE